MKRQRRALDLDRGTILGKYEILKRLASGGMAEIYLARVRGTAGFEKLVVLKRILPHIADDPAFVEMFLDEARLAATLQHPNIADVYDVGEVDGELFFTMEFVHGQDVRAIKMAARKRNETVPLAIGLSIIHGTASALDYAHDKRGADGQLLGLVHRDVSGSNVMISYDGAIKLLDFGIARATLHQHKTQTGTLKGKVPYMSPEQCRGHTLDRRSDLFSLGVLLFELTVGRRPFRGESDFEIMDRIVNHAAPTPSSVIKGYPADLEAVVMKLLARDAVDRYQTAEEMLHELDPFISQHRLWVASKPLGKYMRLAFADRITAWEQAENAGIPFAEHVAETITSRSQRSELMTPPSAFPALQSLSKEMPAVRTSSAQISAQTVTKPLDPVPVSVLPEVRTSGRRVAFIIGGLIVGVLGIVGVYALTAHDPQAATVAKPDPVTTQPPPVAKAPVEDPKPAAKQPVEAKPSPPEPVQPEVVVADEPAKPIVKKGLLVKKPVAKVVKKDPAKDPNVKDPKDAPKDPKDVKEPPHDSTWDPNSPFLPPNP